MNLDLAGLDGRLVKEGEETDVEEEAGAAMLLEEDSTPHCESQLVPHNALSMLRPKDLLRCDLHEVVVTSNDD